MYKARIERRNVVIMMLNSGVFEMPKWLKMMFVSLLSLSIVACSAEKTENSQNEDIEAGQENEVKEDVMTAEGIYVGQVDPHTIEVKIEGEAISLQTTEVDVSFDDIEDGSNVTVEYIENEHGQYVLKSIQVKE